MGFSEKPQVVDGGLDLDGNKRWVIAGIPLRAPLKPIFTNPVEKEIYDESDDGQNNCTTSTTPTSEEAKIPSKLFSSSSKHGSGLISLFSSSDRGTYLSVALYGTVHAHAEQKRHASQHLSN
ncbi:hypothetical protein POTOM_032200 [Populus tomentosa]|uniref:Uncharacterized protein n=1 Tax=Populus tomentosa TaxID=118781 RepID=A0A8X7ZBY4_POPTO|nr:hypothetical protein POTOM_032200 [Populus tomentosa]